MSTTKKPVPTTRVQGHLGPCSLVGSYHLLSLEGDPNQYILEAEDETETNSR